MRSGWALDDSTFNKVFELLPIGKTILELGSGESTKLFKEKGYNVISIEHDINFINQVKNVQYIHAPIIGWSKGNKIPRSLEKRFPEAKGWYDPKTIRKYLPNNYDFIIVDGPTREFGRIGFYIHFDLFRHDVPIIFDDMHRSDDLMLARIVAEKLERDLLVTNNKKGYKPFGLVLP